MTVAVFTHPACLQHRPGPAHPERPERLAAVLAALEAPEFAALAWHEAPRADLAALGRVHDAEYIARLIAAEPAAADETVSLDPDTHLSAGSIEAALRAAGAAIAAVDSVMEGKARFAFAATRPPGHHAEAAAAMGFCLFNQVAAAARHAQARFGLARVAVLDFDVHHGNGTQAMFWPDASLFYGSTHQMPCYPGTGARSETGLHDTIVNRPLPPGAGSAPFRAAWDDILTRLAAFAPDLVLVSAGFDAHAADPLASLTLTEADFAWLAGRLASAFPGRMVSVLEGGYDLAALAASTAAYVRALLEHDRDA